MILATNLDKGSVWLLVKRWNELVRHPPCQGSYLANRVARKLVAITENGQNRHYSKHARACFLKPIYCGGLSVWSGGGGGGGGIGPG